MSIMKAIRVHSFGRPEVLSYEDVPRPEAGPSEVLLRVISAGHQPRRLEELSASFLYIRSLPGMWQVLSFLDFSVKTRMPQPGDGRKASDVRA